MTRIGRLRLLVTATILALAAGGAAIRAQQSGIQPFDARNGEGRQVTLRQQLRVGLKAVTKADFAFIDLVVQKVEAGVLPRKLVDSTFLWARRRVEAQRRQYYKRPMVYFQPALVLRARGVGVKL